MNHKLSLAVDRAVVGKENGSWLWRVVLKFLELFIQK